VSDRAPPLIEDLRHDAGAAISR